MNRVSADVKATFKMSPMLRRQELNLGQLREEHGVAVNEMAMLHYA